MRETGFTCVADLCEIVASKQKVAELVGHVAGCTIASTQGYLPMVQDLLEGRAQVRAVGL